MSSYIDVSVKIKFQQNFVDEHFLKSLVPFQYLAAGAATSSTVPVPWPTMAGSPSKLLRVVVYQVVDGRGVVVDEGPFRLRITDSQFH